MSLERLGWNRHFKRQVSKSEEAVVGRVRLATVRKAHLFTADGTVSVSLPRTLKAVVVGDWLLFDPALRIGIRVLERRNVLARKRPGHFARRQILAANADAALIVATLDRQLRPRQIERYLACVLASGAAPVIVLNKADKCAESEDVAQGWRKTDPRFPVVATSALTGTGIAELEQLLPQRGTTALAGPSGAGKSSLVNALLQSDYLKVGHVRRQDRRGRHTTTRRELVVHPNEYLLMDLPGIRELHPWSDPKSIVEVFPEIATLGENCFYRDCSHGTEPGCQIRDAEQAGQVDPRRLESYFELVEEQRDLARSLRERFKPR